MIQVIVIAPTPMMQAGLQTLLSSTAIHVIGALSFVEDSAHLPTPDVLLLADDAQLEKTSNYLADMHISALVVVTNNDEQTLAFLRVRELRGWSVVPFAAPAPQLQAAVMAAAEGFVAYPAYLAQQQSTIIPPPVERFQLMETDESLTPREREVLELVGQGLSNKLIARALSISEHTVKFHLSSLSAKLGAASRTEAVRLGLRRGLITL